MHHPALYQHLLSIATEILRFQQTTEWLLSYYFKKNNHLGKQDRYFIRESVYKLLRNREKILGFLTQKTSATVSQQIKLAATLAFPSHMSSSEHEWLLNFEQYCRQSILLNEIAELPTWIIERLKISLNDNEIIALGQVLQNNANFDIRTNTIKIKRAELLHLLQQNHLNAIETPYSPWGIRMESHPTLVQHPFYQQGLFEIQDEASQLVAYLSQPKKNQLIIDFCAGAGGKTLAMGTMLNSRGSIYALDVEQSRLQQLKTRLRRSGLSNVFPMLIENELDPKLAKFQHKADLVLVDSPCSGLGTLRRQPDLKYRTSPELLETMNQKQQNILHEASKLCANNGQLIYATCSILPQENEMIVQNFLQNHPEYTAIDCHSLPASIKIDKTNLGMNFNPVYTKTDGFYLAILKKIKDTKHARQYNPTTN